jgi:hypothetical protein
MFLTAKEAKEQTLRLIDSKLNEKEMSLADIFRNDSYSHEMAICELYSDCEHCPIQYVNSDPCENLLKHKLTLVSLKQILENWEPPEDWAMTADTVRMYKCGDVFELVVDDYKLTIPQSSFRIEEAARMLNAARKHTYMGDGINPTRFCQNLRWYAFTHEPKPLTPDEIVAMTEIDRDVVLYALFTDNCHASIELATKAAKGLGAEALDMFASRDFKASDRYWTEYKESL